MATGPPMPQTQAAAPYPGAPPAIYGVSDARGQSRVPGTFGRALRRSGPRTRRGDLALSNAFAALAEEPGKTDLRPQPTILDAIRWR